MREIRNGCEAGVKHDAFCNGRTRNVGLRLLRSFLGERYGARALRKNTGTRTSREQSKSIMLARKMLPFQGPRSFLVSVEASKVIRNAPYEAIRPTTRNGSVISVCEVNENTNGVENFHQHQHDKQMIKDLNVWLAMVQVKQSLPKHLVASAIGARGSGKRVRLEPNR